MVVMTAAFAILLVITPPDAALAAVDPWDVDRVAFLEDWGMTLLGAIMLFEEYRV